MLLSELLEIKKELEKIGNNRGINYPTVEEVIVKAVHHYRLAYQSTHKGTTFQLAVDGLAYAVQRGMEYISDLEQKMLEGNFQYKKIHIQGDSKSVEIPVEVKE